MNPEPIDKNGPTGSEKEIFLALAGNPNSGKTTIFNALTGARHHVGNYPGVTVERKEGELIHRGRRIRVVDLPGTYSLTAYSPDEMVARKVLIEERPDVVIQVVDAGNLERNLYLAVQLIAIKVPLVLAFNMMDEVKKRGVRIDLDHLSTLLGVPIVPTVGFRGQGVSELLDAAVEVARARRRPEIEVRFGSELDRALINIKAALADSSLIKQYDPAWLSIKLLEGDPEALSWFNAAGEPAPLAIAQKERDRVQALMKEAPELLLADARYGFVHGAVAESTSLAVESRRSLTDQADTVLANRILGLPIFLFMMWLTFYATFKLGAPLSALIQKAAEELGGLAASALPGGLVESLIVDGVIAGVGSVLVFLPNIMLLFLMVSIMEDSGYMARAAFIVDRVMHLTGLHGKSFIPLFIGFGCNVPAIMGCRILESERDRRATILVLPFISCSARLPVYVLLTAAFFKPDHAATIIFSLYLLGIAVAMIMARILRVHVIRGPLTPFVMELPPYRLPTLKSVAIHMWERAWLYVKKAGTIILAMSVLVWVLSNFPRHPEPSPELSEAIAKYGSLKKAPPELQARAAQEKMKDSFAGMMGRAIAPVMAPAGLGDWKLGVSIVFGFVAKEVVVSTMSTLYSQGQTNKQDQQLKRALQSDPFMSPLRAYTFMVFVLLYLPCMATLAVARRELGSWKWALFMLVMNVSVAYVSAALVWWIGGIFF